MKKVEELIKHCGTPYYGKEVLAVCLAKGMLEDQDTGESFRLLADKIDEEQADGNMLFLKVLEHTLILYRVREVTLEETIKILRKKVNGLLIEEKYE